MRSDCSIFFCILQFNTFLSHGNTDNFTFYQADCGIRSVTLELERDAGSVFNALFFWFKKQTRKAQ